MASDSDSESTSEDEELVDGELPPSSPYFNSSVNRNGLKDASTKNTSSRMPSYTNKNSSSEMIVGGHRNKVTPAMKSSSNGCFCCKTTAMKNLSGDGFCCKTHVSYSSSNKISNPTNSRAPRSAPSRTCGCTCSCSLYAVGRTATPDERQIGINAREFCLKFKDMHVKTLLITESD